MKLVIYQRGFASPASEAVCKELAIRTSQVNAAQRPKTDSTEESKEESTQQGEQERSNQSSSESSEEESEQVSGEESKEESEDKGESGEKDGRECDSGEKSEEESGDKGEVFSDRTNAFQSVSQGRTTVRFMGTNGPTKVALIRESNMSTHNTCVSLSWTL
ncbi:hypothetical protein Scep_008077 [Stephania cephalantha]|uniref:Uncharacterized protein n=1 Tax=Stephania cephalantha TaxID=152367 RepID=A0AAP0PPB8_9MAGN